MLPFNASGQTSSLTSKSTSAAVSCSKIPRLHHSSKTEHPHRVPVFFPDTGEGALPRRALNCQSWSFGKKKLVGTIVNANGLAMVCAPTNSSLILPVLCGTRRGSERQSDTAK